MRVAIIDDEPLSRERVHRLIGEAEDVEVVGEGENGWDAVELVTRQSPDLLFLDVQMPGLDGISALTHMPPDRLPAIVFTTAYAGYAVQAFEAHAADYLLKPYEAARFREALRRGRQRVAMGTVVREGERLARILATLAPKEGAATAERRGIAPDAAGPVPGPVEDGTKAGGPRVRTSRPIERLPVKHEDRTTLIRVVEIDWIEAASNYVKLHVGRSTHLVRETLSGLGDKLDPTRFIRIHRQTIVNADRIREIQPWFGGDQIVILSTGAKLKVSRSFRDHLNERLLSSA